MKVIEFNDVSKRYKLYSKGGLYLRDRISHALGRLNPFNGHVTVEPELSTVAKSKLTLGTQIFGLSRTFPSRLGRENL